jgi:hypothetical protein
MEWFLTAPFFFGDLVMICFSKLKSLFLEGGVTDPDPTKHL